MRSLNTQDFVGTQPRKISTNKIRYNGNISSINLATGEQIMNGTSLPNSPPRERMNFQQQNLHNSYTKPKQIYHPVDSVKGSLINDENYSFNKDIKKINLNIAQFSNKMSNNININGGFHTSTNNINNSMNISLIFKQNGEQTKLDSVENLKKSLPTANECAPRMKSDNSCNVQKESKKEVEIKLSEKFPLADSNLNDQNNTSNSSLIKQFQDYSRRYSSKNEIQPENDKSLQFSQVKFSVQQGVINLFDMKKEDEQPLSRSQILQNRVNTQQSNEQRSFTNLNLTTTEKNINFYSNSQAVNFRNSNCNERKNILNDNKNNLNDIRSSHNIVKNYLNDSKLNLQENKNNISFQSKQQDQTQIKSSPEFYQVKGIPTKNVIAIHNMFNTDRTSQISQKQFNLQIQQGFNIQNIDSINGNILDDEVQPNSNGGGFYREESPTSLKPLDMPQFDIKILGERKLSSKDLSLNKKSYPEQKKIQLPISNQSVNRKSKLDNTKRESKKVQLLQTQSAKEQRIIVVCETSNQTREWVNRFLGMRNIFEYESFTLPGGPGCFSLDNIDEKNCWQNTFKQFITNMCKIYQIQEIQIYQNNNSVYSNIFQAEAVTGRGQTSVYQENLRQACQFVKECTQLPVKGYNINTKGIIEKSI